MKLLVVVPRGLQAAMLGPYGNRWIDTPNFDILATAGTVFDWHFSQRPGAAHAAWRGFPDLIETLKSAGVECRLVHDSSRLIPEPFLQGWHAVHGRDGMEAVLKKARGQLRELLAVESWMLWVEFGSLLPPWRIAGQFLDAAFKPPLEPEPESEEGVIEEVEERLEPILSPPLGMVDSEDDERFLAVQTTYAAAVMQLDAVLGELLDGLPDEVHLLVTSDAGLPLGEHGWMGEGGGLFSERTHVPLLLLGPGVRAGRRVDALTGSMDVAPAIAGLVGGSLAFPSHEALMIENGERALRTAEWLLRLPADGPAALYEKPADKGEVLDVAGANFAKAEELEARLKSLGESSGQSSQPAKQ